MKSKPGDRQIDRGRSFKDNTGSTPNGVANRWLSARIGEQLRIEKDGKLLCKGLLVGFDAYSFLIVDKSVERLVFKGPGTVIVGSSE